jgi:hypothetical protein
MNKFLYFSKGAPDATEGTEEVIMVPVEHVSHFEMQSATRLDVHFTKAVGQVIEDADAGDNNRSIAALDITSGKHKEVLQDIAAAINAHPNLDPCVVIADSQNSVFASAHITSCVGIDVIDRP